MHNVLELLARKRALLDRRQEAEADGLAEVERERREISQGVSNGVLIAKPFAPAQLITAISKLLNAGPAP